MLCEKCHEREATVHYTTVDGEKVSKVDLCEECAGLSTQTEGSACYAMMIEPGLSKRAPKNAAAKLPKLCEKCHERTATVHICKIDGNETTTGDFCIECVRPGMAGRSGIELEDVLKTLESVTPEASVQREFIKAALGKSFRYPIYAYEFVIEAMDACFKGTPVPASVLLETIRELALKKFGKRTKAALAEWKIFRTEDFGEIVFEMIDAGILWKQPGDAKEDFQNGFDFDEAFPES